METEKELIKSVAFLLAGADLYRPDREIWAVILSVRSGTKEGILEYEITDQIKNILGLLNINRLQTEVFRNIILKVRGL